MSVSRRYFAPGQLQFITSSVYRRLKLFDSYRLRLMFVEVLREYRQQLGFLLRETVSGTVFSQGGTVSGNGGGPRNGT